MTSKPSTPRTSKAVERASVSVAQGRTTAARQARWTGSPNRGSITCPKVRSPSRKDLLQMPETPSERSVSATSPSRFVLSPDGGTPRRVHTVPTRVESGGTGMAAFQTGASGEIEAAQLLLVPWMKARSMPASRSESTAASMAQPCQSPPDQASSPDAENRTVNFALFNSTPFDPDLSSNVNRVIVGPTPSRP